MANLNAIADGIAKQRAHIAKVRADLEVTTGEYAAATEHITWGYDDPHGRFKKDDPIGVKEYLRRQQKIKADPSWQRMDGY